MALRISQKVLSDNSSSMEDKKPALMKDDFMLSSDFKFLKYFLKMKSKEEKNLMNQYVWYVENSKHFVTECFDYRHWFEKIGNE